MSSQIHENGTSSTSYPWKIIAAAAVLLTALAFTSSREIRLVWWRHQLQYWVTHVPGRPSGGKDLAFVEALDALEKMRNLGADREARESLVFLIQDSRWDVRAGACLLLAGMEEGAIPALPELELLASDPVRPADVAEDIRACADMIRERKQGLAPESPATP